MAEQQLIRKIIHVDMDAFYASVEQRNNPAYRGKPVIVGGSPNSRGVVSTASYEARKYGVHSAMPSSKAARLCPHAIFIKPNFVAYKQVSAKIREIFYDYTDLVEPLSLDEAYLDVTENHKGNPSATLIAKEILNRIREETDLTASAGVSYCKFLAKIASDVNKPNGLTLITPKQAQDFLLDLDVKKFHGVGKATQKKMHSLGIKTGADLLKWSELDLIQSFGKQGRHYYRIVRGIDNREVQPDRIRKSYSKEETFADDIDDLEWILSFLEEMSTKISIGMKKASLSGKTITLKVRYKDFKTITRSLSLPNYVNDSGTIYDVTRQLLVQTDAGNKKVRLLGIGLSNLNVNETDSYKQLEFRFKA